MKKLFFILLLFSCFKQTSIAQPGDRKVLKQQLSTAKDDTTKINLLWNIAFTYAFVHQDTAIIYANKGLELAKKTGYKVGEANCLNTLGMSLTGLGNYPAALQYSFDFLSISETLRDTSLIVRAYELLAICYREQEDYTEALKYSHKAEALSRNAHVTLLGFNMRPFTLGTLSSIYERINRLDSALYYGQESYKLEKGWSGLYLKLGTIYFKLGQKDTALYYYRKGIPLAEKSLIYIDLVDIYNKMSEVFESAGNKDSSVYYAKKSIVQQGVLTYPEGRLRAATQLANLYESQGLKDSAIKYLKLSADLRGKMFDREKTREAQALAFNDKLHQQELSIQKGKEQNRIKMYGLLGIAIVFLVIAFILWRNNKVKQRANIKIEKAYTALKSTQSQLIQSEKMASLGELTAGIAHEIQNPLNFVNNFSEVNKELVDELKSELSTGNMQLANEIADDIKDNSEKINHHGKRADAIVKGMLQHSRTNSGQKEPTDINALADEYLRLAYHGLRAKDKNFNAEIKTDFDPAIGRIGIVPQDIGRVLLNLYNNAFYAVTEKKKLQSDNYEPTVVVSTQTVKPPLGGLGVLISVKDNGNGIPQKVLDKIFQPFFTTKPTGQGTGLGLSLAYDIIKAHGGEIKVETREGEGSEFIIQLPVV